MSETATVTECYFDKIENNFTSVTIANGIDTDEFLKAAVCAVRLFGIYIYKKKETSHLVNLMSIDKLGNSSFAVIQNDMNQNIQVRQFYIIVS
jgi:hypothetical protein